MAKLAEIDKDKCKSCGYCVHYCPVKAISLSGKSNKLGYDYAFVDKEKCTGCQICYTVCPDICITIYEEK